jgi:hypothetical protein
MTASPFFVIYLVKGDGCAELGLHQKPSDEVGCIPVGNLLQKFGGALAMTVNAQNPCRSLN